MLSGRPDLGRRHYFRPWLDVPISENLTYYLYPLVLKDLYIQRYPSLESFIQLTLRDTQNYTSNRTYCLPCSFALNPCPLTSITPSTAQILKSTRIFLYSLFSLIARTSINLVSITSSSPRLSQELSQGARTAPGLSNRHHYSILMFLLEGQ